MSKCFNCGAPDISEYTQDVYWAVKRLGETTAKDISMDLKMTIQQANNYLLLLCNLNLLTRRKSKRIFLYRWVKY